MISCLGYENSCKEKKKKRQNPVFDTFFVKKRGKFKQLMILEMEN